MFISDALAQTVETAAATPSAAGTMIQLGLIFVVFYLLLLRPMSKQRKQHESMLASIKKGDRIITGGGIYAKVIKVTEGPELVVEIANGLEITINRETVRGIIADTNSPVAKAEKKEAKAANTNKKTKAKK